MTADYNPALPTSTLLSRTSVICATYNGAKFINTTIKALRNQSEKPLEAIFVDDCSVDKTPDILSESCGSGFSFVRNDTNLGVVGTRNRAINLSKTRYIAINDQDDISHRHRLKTQADFLDRNPEVSCVYTSYVSINENGERVPVKPNTAINYSGEFARAGLLFKNFITHSTIMFRRDAVKGEVYLPDFPLCEDYSLLIRLADFKAGLKFLPGKLLSYRVHSQNHSKAGNSLIRKLDVKLKAEILNRLDINPNESELRIHELFSSESFSEDASVLPHCRKWLEFLHYKNQQRGYIDSTAFESVLANEWLELCHKFSDSGRGTWHQYRQGSWSIPMGSYPSMASLFLKTSLK